MSNIARDIRDGNVAAFKELFEDYYPVLCVFASKYLSDGEACKDVAQETLVSYWEHRAEFDDIHQVRGYLYTVARNRCLNQLKREAVNAEAVETIRRESDEAFEENYLEQETYRLVREAVDALPPQMRSVIRLSMEGMTNPEIARRMGVTEGTVHATKKAAYRKLRDALKEHFYLLLLV